MSSRFNAVELAGEKLREATSQFNYTFTFCQAEAAIQQHRLRTIGAIQYLSQSRQDKFRVQTIALERPAVPCLSEPSI